MSAVAPGVALGALPGAAPGLELRRDDLLGPDALAMIGEGEAELAGLYPPAVRMPSRRIGCWRRASCS